ncbi:MAG TPA: NAD(P)-dependent oxidoreductase [Aurantimonas sp.]|uniref:NAD(P)-dependent oxidoreductase n=1 Tax=Aurantimonas marianensis TaxID=2920428 RepID=A0A9X2H7L7_9HYPH|nr:NAD(P)-dependent oxidoreductase [Aurantimonas marianensis]MCP3055213.1 NAD(P)-dependent oxidoreductase [Aurantimonas marianensis]
MSLENITLIGTGIMGAPMARNIAKAGFRVTVWNRTRAKADALAGVATVAADPREAVAEADAVITMVDNSPIVTEIYFGEHGVVEAAPSNALFIDMSSIQPSVARDHAASIEKAGRRHIDAPVSGGEKGAIEGTLAIMAGGRAEDFAEAEQALKAMGRPTHVGVHGAGQVAKLANQAIVAVTIGAVAEAMLLAQEGGCDPAALRDALMGGFATSRILDLHGERMTERNWVPGGPLELQLKDLENALEVAREAGLTLPLTEKARDAFHALAKEMEMGRHDHAAYLRWLEAINPGKRLGTGPDRDPGANA